MQLSSNRLAFDIMQIQSLQIGNVDTGNGCFWIKSGQELDEQTKQRGSARRSQLDIARCCQLGYERI